ncbi:TIGR03083 family protein [Haloechinothrix alba]|uniref:TIGR03083 family protein n=1 Tax=Haloechinothrix alba TaxID=664784 RepID=A0A238W2Y0_9PSEU|nr:maleylpyruvate isomerase N-terminal domain-containing protein [Haloechinothrix alba]SNR40503.1 TIGR03083 family protein [Haloechinothrix alba]
MTTEERAGHQVLLSAYSGVVDALRGISEGQAWLPTGCTGWCVRDVLFHLMRDAERALVALNTPAGGEPDTDAISYWRAQRSSTDPTQHNLRMTRISASVYPTFEPLFAAFDETATAAVHAARSSGARRTVRTQGCVLLVEDLITTLIVEAAIHHLDLVVVLDRPGPSEDALRVVRGTLDGLLGEPLPFPVENETYARIGTGRRSLTAEQRHALGWRAHRFPLLG